MNFICVIKPDIKPTPQVYSTEVPPRSAQQSKNPISILGIGSLAGPESVWSGKSLTMKYRYTKEQ
jgi:hypothetical protein